MFILRDLLPPLQQEFSNTPQGQKRQRFYTFMASTTLPWKSLWKTFWGLIPDPATLGRILLQFDDSISPKTGRKIFACSHFHNHAAKKNETTYPWSQCIVAIGLLKQVKNRWASLPLDFRFYLMKKDIDAEKQTVKNREQLVPFLSKMDQAASMIKGVFSYYKLPVLVITNSWFGNNGLWSRLDQGGNGNFHLLSRFRTNIPILPCMTIRLWSLPAKNVSQVVPECSCAWWLECVRIWTLKISRKLQYLYRYPSQNIIFLSFPLVETTTV